jgi:two-component system sensor histidine kinase KdpD
VAGVIETHGRADTAAQQSGLEILPRRTFALPGTPQLTEFDLDAALARKPALILVDELAHSNVTGSRHPKRWQDVDELLAAGIDVWTTLNVQHLESLNDVVGGITGVRVQETLPDTFFDRADEIVLVDTPADELLARLRAGKVYGEVQAGARRPTLQERQPHGVARGSLRRRRSGRAMSRRIEATVRSIASGRPAAILLHRSERRRRARRESAALLAQQLASLARRVRRNAGAATPAGSAAPAHRGRKLAEDLGAATAILPGSVADSVIDYARENNLSKLVAGHNGRASAPGRDA